MKKEAVKLFKKYGNHQIEIVKNYKPKTKGKKTTAIKGSRMAINQALGRIMIDGSKKEREIASTQLKGDYFEDWDSTSKEIIKY